MIYGGRRYPAQPDQTILPEVIFRGYTYTYTSYSTGKPKGIIHTSAGYLLTVY